MAMHVHACICMCVCVCRPTSSCSRSTGGGFVSAWLFHQDQSYLIGFRAAGVKVRFNISQNGKDLHWVGSLG